MSIQYASYGKAGPLISRLGFGAMRLPTRGKQYARVNFSASARFRRRRNLGLTGALRGGPRPPAAAGQGRNGNPRRQGYVGQEPFRSVKELTVPNGNAAKTVDSDTRS